jgi:hypothetical protein
MRVILAALAMAFAFAVVSAHHAEYTLPMVPAGYAVSAR